MFTWFGRRGEVLLLVRVRTAFFLVGRLGSFMRMQGLKDPRLLNYCSGRW